MVAVTPCAPPFDSQVLPSIPAQQAELSEQLTTVFEELRAQLRAVEGRLSAQQDLAAAALEGLRQSLQGLATEVSGAACADGAGLGLATQAPCATRRRDLADGAATEDAGGQTRESVQPALVAHDISCDTGIASIAEQDDELPHLTFGASQSVPFSILELRQASSSDQTESVRLAPSLLGKRSDSPLESGASSPAGPGAALTAADVQVATPAEDREVRWQWEHKSGWRDYEAFVSSRIEDAYQKGLPTCRLKCGKNRVTPMGLFFVEMLQHDPTTGNTRRIRRVGPKRFIMRLKVQAMILGQMLEAGSLKRSSFKDFHKKHIEIIGHDNDKSGVQLFRNKQLKDTGLAATIVKNYLFFCVSLFLVLANAVWVGVDADGDSEITLYESSRYRIVIENIFCLYFSGELLLNISALRRKRHVFTSGWLLFDMMLVCLMVAETWVLPLVLWVTGVELSSHGTGAAQSSAMLRMVRVLRLTRLGRVVRLMRRMPEVMMMLKGIGTALRSVFTTMILLLVLLYSFGIVFKAMSEENERMRGMFPSVGSSMYRLFMHGSLLDGCTKTMDFIVTEDPFLGFAFLVFIILSSFVTLNMLVGILCDVVREVSLAEKDKAARAKLRTTLVSVLEAYDKENDEHLAQQDFALCLTNPEIHDILTGFGVDATDLLSLQGVLFQDKSDVDATYQARASAGTLPVRKLSFQDFVEVVMRLRGRNSASVMDIADFREYVRQRFDHLDQKTSSLGRGSIVSPGFPDLHSDQGAAPAPDLCERGSQCSPVSVLLQPAMQVRYASPNNRGNQRRTEWRDMAEARCLL